MKTSDEAHFEYSESRVPVQGWPVAIATIGSHEFRLEAVITPQTNIAEQPSVGITPQTVFGESMIDEELATFLTVLFLSRQPEGFYNGVHLRYEV